jgi:hypothetical protein
MVTGAHQKTHTCQGKKRLEATAGGPQMFSELAYSCHLNVRSWAA